MGAKRFVDYIHWSKDACAHEVATSALVSVRLGSRELNLRNELFHATAVESNTRTTNMVHLTTAEEWQKQSMLLLQARPTTVRKCI